jgi:hypothetical protein
MPADLRAASMPTGQAATTIAPGRRESVLKKTEGPDDERAGHADILREQIDGTTGRWPSSAALQPC